MEGIYGVYVYLCLGGGGNVEKETVVAIFMLSHTFITASLILYELSQLGSYSYFIQSMCFLMTLKYAGCNVFFFYFSLLILFLGKHLCNIFCQLIFFLN